MDGEQDNEGRGFKVEDRRSFNADGSAKEGAPETDAEKEKVEKDCGCEESFTQLPDIDFATFILSLASSVLMHLGEIPRSDTDEKSVNLSMAKQTIDILGIIQDKTRGNLDMEEDRLLKELLYDLRMKYVTVCKEN